MGVIASLLIGFIHIAVAALDVAAVFLMARFAALRWRWKWLLAFSGAGKPLTDYLLGAYGAIVERRGTHAVREAARIAICLLAILLVRLVIVLSAAALT